MLGPELASFRSSETGAEIVRKVEELYLSDYIRLWDGFLNDLELVTPMNVEQLADMLRAVSQPNSPVKTVLQAIASQTKLAGALRAAEQARQAPATGQLEKLKGKIKEFITPSQSTAATIDPTERVDAHFQPLIRLVSEDGGQAPIDATLRPLGELYTYIVQSQQADADPKRAIDTFMSAFPKATALSNQLQSAGESTAGADSPLAHGCRQHGDRDPPWRRSRPRRRGAYRTSGGRPWRPPVMKCSMADTPSTSTARPTPI